MTRLTRKYEFTNEAAADAAIAALPHDEEGNPIHGHSIVRLGYIVKTAGTYDEEGNEVTPPVLSDKYAVDVLWKEEPLASWEPNIVWPTPLGVHSFGSSSSRDEYAKTYCELFPDSLYCNPPEPTEEDLI
jgi:hypothetical protein